MRSIVAGPLSSGLLQAIREGQATPNNPPRAKELTEQVYLDNFCWAPDSCHSEQAEVCAIVSEKVHVHAVFLLVYHLNLLDYTSHSIFRELISVIIAQPFTPNKLRGFNKRNSLALSLLGKITPSFTSQTILRE